ncbi:MAG: carboxypeptidase-like regulatory domain-containing protein, partial [Planctomycetota bacterium]
MLDAVTFQPVVGATVVARLGCWPCIAETTTQTDQHGHFRLPGPRGSGTDTVQLIATRPGYGVSLARLHAVSLSRRPGVATGRENPKPGVLEEFEPAQPRRLMVPHHSDFGVPMCGYDAMDGDGFAEPQLLDHAGHELARHPTGFYRHVATIWLYRVNACRRVHGTVTSAGNPPQPLAGAVVTLDIGDSELMTTTDAAGHYDFPPVAGDPSVRVHAPGFEPGAAYIEDDDADYFFDTTQPWTARVHATTDVTLDVELSRSVAPDLWGTVVDAAGRPVTGALVSVREALRDRAARTDANGAFRLPFSPAEARNSNLFVAAPGFLFARRNVVAGQPQRVVLQPAVTLNVRLTSAGIAPPPDLRAYLFRGWSAADDVPLAWNSLADEAWRMQGNQWCVAPGTEYTLKAGVELLDEAVRLRGEQTFTTPSSGAIAIDLPLEQTAMPLSRLQFVALDDGAPVPGLRLRAWLNLAPLAAVQTDALGVVVLPVADNTDDYPFGTGPMLWIETIDGERLAWADELERGPGHGSTMAQIEHDMAQRGAAGDHTLVVMPGGMLRLTVNGAPADAPVVARYRQQEYEHSRFSRDGPFDQSPDGMRRFHVRLFWPAIVEIRSPGFRTTTLIVDPDDPASLSPEPIRLQRAPHASGMIRWPDPAYVGCTCNGVPIGDDGRFSVPLTRDDGHMWLT